MVLDFHQDDPRKCTSARLRRLGLVRGLRKGREIPSSAVVLNPLESRTLSGLDRKLVEEAGLVGLDCSWNRFEEVLSRRFPGEGRRLPTLLAGNPTSYAMTGRLSTVEALAAALLIMGFDREAGVLLAPFKWGETFLTLNKEPLKAYAKAGPEELAGVEAEFFPATGP